MPLVSPRDETWNPALDAALVAPTPSVLARLHEPGALVVTTGQQPGLFGGPLYTVHKAIAAVALARELTLRWDRPVIPVFWLAGDDHDHAEAGRAAWIDSRGALVEWSLPARARDAVQRPMYQEPLGPAVFDGIALLRAGLPSSDLSAIERWWTSERTVHAAFAGWVAELLAPLGVACVDPTHHAFKRAQLPLIATALHRAGDLDAALAKVEDAGTGIDAGAGATLVFVETDVGRDRLVIDGDGFRARRSGQHFTRSAMHSLLERDPSRFSANVLLRPVVESACLPTVAYVAGPGELRYLERQVSVLFRLLDQPAPAAVPRWGGLVAEPFVDRLLDRLDLVAGDVMQDDGTLAREILRRDLPDAVEPALDALRDTISTSGTALHEAGREIDAVLDRAIGGRLRRAAAIVDDLERLLERHLRRRSDIAHTQFQRITTALLPGGVPQERVLSSAPMYAMHGATWIDAAVTAATDWASTVVTPSSSGALHP
ncbi:MAG: bacillithiol biosynthesis cysteine-adding enzyme BshC [Gemmatimonadales bacterium]